MKEALEALLPMYLFMLLPVWIPLFSVTIGAVLDAVRLQPSARRDVRLVAVDERRSPEAPGEALAA